MSGPSHCHNLCLIMAPLAQVPVSAISDISGQWWSPLVQLSSALSLISISSLSLTRQAIELIPVTVSSLLIGWKVAPEPSHWPDSILLRAGYRLVKRILYID